MRFDRRSDGSQTIARSPASVNITRTGDDLRWPGGYYSVRSFGGNDRTDGWGTAARCRALHRVRSLLRRRPRNELDGGSRRPRARLRRLRARSRRPRRRRSGRGRGPGLRRDRDRRTRRHRRRHRTQLDPSGHGTFVAGLIAAHGESFKGVAPDAKVVSLRVLDQKGDGTMHSVLAAFDWLLRNRSAYHIRVLNLSFGAKQTTSYHRT